MSLAFHSSRRRSLVQKQRRHQLFVLNVDGFSCVIVEPLRDILGRAVLVIEVDVFLGDKGVHSRNDGSRTSPHCACYR